MYIRSIFAYLIFAYENYKDWMSSLTVWRVRFSGGAHVLRSPSATDTLTHSWGPFDAVPVYLWVTAVDKQCCTAPSAAAVTLLMFTRRMWHGKRRKCASSGPLAAAHSLSAIHRALRFAVSPSGTAERDHKWLRYRPITKLLIGPLPTHMFTCFYHWENSWLLPAHSGVHTHRHTPVTALAVYQFAFGMSERGGGGDREDEFKNTLAQWKSTGDFCVQVCGKVI